MLLLLEIVLVLSGKTIDLYGRFYRIVYGIDVNQQLQLAICIGHLPHVSWAGSGLWWIWIWMKPIWEAP